MNDNVDWEAAIRPVVEHVWKVIHERLVKLRDRLDPWLNGMLAGPIPANWREELARFAEQTRAEGLVIRPEGMAVLEKTIQGRVDAEARQKQRATAVLAAPVASLPSSRPGTAVGSSKSPGRVARSTGATFFNGDGERQRGAQVAALVEREVNGKTWVYFQKEPGGPWFGVPKKTYFLHDAAGNLLNDSFGIPRSARDLTGAKEVDWLTSTSLNHPADAGWSKIAKQYGGLLPIDPQELREDLSKSGSVAGPLIRYTAKTAAFVVIAGALAKGLGKGVEKGAEALLGRGEKEIVKHAVEETANAGEAAKIAESAAGKQAVKSGEKAAQKAESALAKEAAAGESAAAKAEGQVEASLAKSKTSLREQYLGRTPGKASRTGQEVIGRMEAEGNLRWTAKGTAEVRYVDPTTKLESWHPIHATDMGHLDDAVKYWNETGRYLGPKHPEVRKWMLDPASYQLQPSGVNRSSGAKLKDRYLPPGEE